MCRLTLVTDQQEPCLLQLLHIMHICFGNNVGAARLFACERTDKECGVCAGSFQEWERTGRAL